LDGVYGTRPLPCGGKGREIKGILYERGGRKEGNGQKVEMKRGQFWEMTSSKKAKSRIEGRSFSRKKSDRVARVCVKKLGARKRVAGNIEARSLFKQHFLREGERGNSKGTWREGKSKKNPKRTLIVGETITEKFA